MRWKLQKGKSKMKVKQQKEQKLASTGIVLSAQPEFWLINTDQAHGAQWEIRMYKLKVASVTPAAPGEPRPRIEEFRLISPGDGILLYSNNVGIIVCGVAQASMQITVVEAQTYWDIPLGGTWHKLLRPLPYDELPIDYPINSTVIHLDRTIGRQIFEQAQKR
jgi:hypothetical protein